MLSKQEDPAKSINFLISKASTWAMLMMLQSLASMAWLLLIPKEPGNAVFLGYSLRRLALLIPMSLPLLAGLIIWISARKKAQWIQQLFSERLNNATGSVLVVGGALLAAGIWSFVFLFFIYKFFPDLGAYLRLMPWLTSYFLLGMEAMLFVPIFMFPQESSKPLSAEKFPLKTFLIGFFLLIALFILIEFTGLGKNPERVSIISLGTPILEGQIWYIIGLLILIILTGYAWQSIPAKSKAILGKRGDVIIIALLWLMSVVLWMSLPLPSHNYFAPAVQPPNFEKYPFSDAEQYDLNSLFVYYGSLDNFVVSKPMYVSFLAILHAIGGLSYANIVFLQTLIVAIFPPVLYLIGRELHSRLGGIAIALFAIFREVSNIQATSIANTSNTKLLLSDMPAALLAAVLALIFIRWFKLKEKRISGYEFLVGGLIGIFILTRLQTMALVPFALILAVIHSYPKFNKILVSCLILLASISLVIAPVLIRNHSITGVFWVDNPSSSRGLSRILTTGIETTEDVLSQSTDNPIEKNFQVFEEIFKNNLFEYIYSISDNFSRNLISSILVLPIRWGNHTPFLEFLTITTSFWSEVYSQSNIINSIVIFGNLALISLGFAKVFRRNPWPVLVILGLYIVYNLSSAVVRLSGWRFILPIDWIIYAFFALGIVEILKLMYFKITRADFNGFSSWLSDYPAIKISSTRKLPALFLYGIGFLMAGAFIPAREHLLPTLLPEYSKQEVCERIDLSLNDHGYVDLSENFMAFCLSEDTRVLKGYGIYPRFFNSGEGYYDRSYDPWFGRQDYGRLAFRLIGTRNAKVYIKTDIRDLRFPNGTLVYLAGRDQTKFEAQFVLVEGPEPELIIASPILSGEKPMDLIN